MIHRFAPSTADGGDRARVIQTTIVVAALCALALGLWRARGFYHDDAYIALRYAQRLLSGEGLTWTDAERVEGYTSPLWVLLSAGLGAVGVPLETASRALGLIALGGLVAFAFRVAGPLALMIVAAHPGLVIWSLGGLETAGFTLCLAIASWLVCREPGQRDSRSAWLAGCLFAASGLLRPEGFLAGVLGSTLLWRTHRAHAVCVLTPVVAAAFGWLAFRITYYRDWLPNVAYAKGVGIPMTRRLVSAAEYFVTSGWFIVPAVVTTIAALMAGHRACGRILWFSLSVVAGIAFAGGDHMPYARLLSPAIPLFAIAIACAAQHSGGRRLAIQSIAIAAAAIPFVYQWTRPIERDYAATVGAGVGRFLEQNLAGGSLVAVATAGSTPFHAPSLRFIDTMGLNDRAIARAPVVPVQTRLQRYAGHLKGDGAYVLSRRPDVIVLGPAEGYLGNPPDAWTLTDYQLIQSPGFRSDYVPFGFRAPVTAAETTSPRVRELLDLESRTLRFIAYLHRDSERARDLAYRGVLLRAPWE